MLARKYHIQALRPRGIPLAAGPACLKIFGGVQVPKRLGGEALFAPGRLGAEPYPLGVGLKIFGGGAQAIF
jgi:hypothetical protein